MEIFGCFTLHHNNNVASQEHHNFALRLDLNSNSAYEDSSLPCNSNAINDMTSSTSEH